MDLDAAALESVPGFSLPARGTTFTTDFDSMGNQADSYRAHREVDQNSQLLSQISRFPAEWRLCQL